MQMNKAVLRNSEIVIFDKKKFHGRPGEFFFSNPLDRKQFFFSRRPIVCLSRLSHFKFFKGCLPQMFLGLFLNTLTHIRLEVDFKMKPFHTNGKVAKQ